MATVQQVVSAREFDIFSKPHDRLRRLIASSARQVKEANFCDAGALKSLLVQLQRLLRLFHSHEEIEDKYIMNVLKHRLTGPELSRLIEHLSADSHIEEMLEMVKDFEERLIHGLDSFSALNYGQELLKALNTFYDDYLPHMVEEEQVYLPMILRYFTYDELKDMRWRVLDLQQADLESSEKLSISLEGKGQDDVISDSTAEEQGAEHREGGLFANIPSELIIKVLSYLSVDDLCRTAQTCRLLSKLSYDGQLWTSLAPTEWSKGNWSESECECLSGECNCDCEPNYSLMAFQDLSGSDIELFTDPSSVGESNEVEGDRRVRRETDVLLGVSRYVLPKVGPFVEQLKLGCSKAISNGLLYRMLVQCPRLEYLDISQTIISDLGLNGLFKGGGGKYLKHLDVSGCTGVTDKTLIKLGQAFGKSKSNIKRESCLNCNCRLMSSPSPTQFGLGLRFLALSGCYKVTDYGLRALAKNGGLPNLKHLDLSGCLNVSGIGICDLIKDSLTLDHSQLYYCDNIEEGPYADTASGCQNVDCKHRVCCRAGMVG